MEKSWGIKLTKNNPRDCCHTLKFVKEYFIRAIRFASEKKMSVIFCFSLLIIGQRVILDTPKHFPDYLTFTGRTRTRTYTIIVKVVVHANKIRTAGSSY